MIYKNFHGKKISALGLGAMRFPTVQGDNAKIDETATAEMIDYAIKNGINYFDTAWMYHSGQSELVLGRILKNYPRESFYLADKFPGFDLSNINKVEEIFEKQLEKCQVEYFDFYLFHNLCEINVDQYLDPAYRIYDYLMEQKRNGRIKHLGFSTHGTLETMKRFLDAYGKDMEFCQLQINWLDWSFQSAKEKVELVRSYGIPVWVMEPVRGGRLANVEFNGCLKGRNAPEIAFRFLQGIEDVVVTLSGMSNFDQLAQNIKTYETDAPLTREEEKELLAFAEELTGKSLPCTACRYCVDKCPKGLDIPYLISLFNEHTFSGGGFIAPMAFQKLSEEKKPWACISCKVCEKVCPQNIKISEAMKKFSGIMR